MTSPQPRRRSWLERLPALFSWLSLLLYVLTGILLIGPYELGRGGIAAASATLCGLVGGILGQAHRWSRFDASALGVRMVASMQKPNKNARQARNQRDGNPGKSRAKKQQANGKTKKGEGHAPENP